MKLLTWIMMMNLCKHVNRPGGTTTVGTDYAAVTTPHDGYDVSIRVESNMKLCVFYLEHQERVFHKRTMDLIDLALVHSFRDWQKWEETFKMTTVEPMINDTDWPQVVSIMGAMGAPLTYVIVVDSIMTPAATDPVKSYLMVHQEMTYHALHKGESFINYNHAALDIMLYYICGWHLSSLHIRPRMKKAYELLFDHYIGPNTVGNMVSAADTKLASTWEIYV
jgi:hypothetical protein